MRKDELVGKILANLAKQGVVMEAAPLMKVTETLLSTIKEVLIGGHHIEIRGFGTFSVRDRSNRTAWNPVKKVTFTVQGKKVPFFKPGTIFRKEVQQGHLLSDKTEEAEA